MQNARGLLAHLNWACEQCDSASIAQTKMENWSFIQIIPKAADLIFFSRSSEND